MSWDIEKMLAEQKKFGQHFRNYGEFDETEFKDLVLSELDEVHSLLNTINWKKHRNFSVDKIRSNQLEELVDIFKYWLELVAYLGFTPNEIENEFWRKSRVVEQRYQQEMVMKLDKYAVVDIDGVLTDYPNSFIGKKIKSLKMKDIADELDISIEKLREMKHEWRQNGGYGKLEPNYEGIKIVKYLKQQGYGIVLLSNRPVSKYKRIYADTMDWLQKHEIPYDALIFTDGDKAFENIVKSAEFVIEDDPVQIEMYRKMGIKVMKFWKFYNSRVKAEGNFKDFKTFVRFFHYIKRKD